MPNAKNVATLAKIKEELEGASAVWVVDACGLTVKESQTLRRSIREAGGHMTVYKNTLMHRALADAELPTLDDVLEGPSAFVFAGDDIAATAKAVKNFAKTNETLEIKGGHRIPAVPRGTLREDRRCYLRCGSWPGRCPQRGAQRFGAGNPAGCQPEGSCLTARAA